MKRSLFLLLALPLLASCQTAPQGEGSANSNLITQEELDPLAAITVYQAVQRLRPAWLRTRSAGVRGEGGREQRASVQVAEAGSHTTQVFVDGMPRGDLDILRQLDVRDFREIRYLSASDATTRYGTGYQGGIIEVFTKQAS